MTCVPVKLANDARAIICLRRQRTRVRLCSDAPCHETAELQCDYQVSKRKTCDAYICVEHGQERGPDRHYCPRHHATDPERTQLELL